MAFDRCRVCGCFSACDSLRRSQTDGRRRDEPTLKNGRVEQSNFNDYRALRINEAPIIEVHLVINAEAPGGIGEPSTVGIAPALTNAIFAATGKRIRKLPVKDQLRSA